MVSLEFASRENVLALLAMKAIVVACVCGLLGPNLSVGNDVLVCMSWS
jgi:hypothetical protein